MLGILYLAVYLLMFTFFLLLKILPLILCYFVGRAIDDVFEWTFMRWLLPGLFILVVGSWAGVSYYFFNQECQKLKPVQGNIVRFTPAPGIQIVSSERGGRFEYAIRNGFISYAKHDHYIQCADKLPGGEPPIYNVESGKDCDQFASVKPLAELNFTEKKRISNWWWAPIYMVETRMTDASGALLGVARELIIGGGKLGEYQRTFGGDQDYEYLSCGYISSNIGPWRPTLTNRPEYKRYEIADTIFVTRALAEK